MQEPSAELTARRERRRRLTALAGELEAVVREQLDELEAEEVRLRDRAAELDDRQRAGAELADRAAWVEELGRRMREAEERIAREERLKAERALAEDALAARQGELERRERGLAAAEESLAGRERAAGEREAAFAELDRREQELAGREREVEQRLQNVSAREFLADRVEPLRFPGADADRGGVAISRIEELVSSNRARFPDRASEWDAYLFQLRPQAGPDGRLPRSLTGLVEEVFAPLL